MSKLKSINNFLECKHIAVAGVSRSRSKFGSVIFRELRKKGYNVYPVNPNIDTYEGQVCYPGISALPDDVGSLVINTSPALTLDLIQQAENKGIRSIWVQQGAENTNVIKYAEDKDNIITKECLMMYCLPVKFPHSLHRFIRKIFGKNPK